MIKIAEVTFRGNNEKIYEFFTDIDAIQSGDYAVVDTQNGPSFGKVVKLKDFSKRTKFCIKWVLGYINPEEVNVARQDRHDQELAAAELEEMLEL